MPSTEMKARDLQCKMPEFTKKTSSSKERCLLHIWDLGVVCPNIDVYLPIILEREESVLYAAYIAIVAAGVVCDAYATRPKMCIARCLDCRRRTARWI